MKRNEIKSHLLSRYLAGECSASERQRVKQWMDADPENRKAMEQYKHIWDTSARPRNKTRDKFETGDAWETVSRRMDAPVVVSGKVRKKRFVDYAKLHTPRRDTFLRVAAMFLVAALIGIFAYTSGIPVESSETEPTLRRITTEKGQRVNLTLSDGTRVLLNADSEIELPNVFAPDMREVYLKGQAYFNVASNAEKPFVIHSGNTTTRVLGTAFSIRAYPEDDQITVAVEEGRVSFQANTGAEGTPTILNMHELGRYNGLELSLTTAKIEDPELHLGWVEGYLKFREAPMSDVARELERRYGVTVVFAQSEIEDRSLTALFKSRSIRNVLDMISRSLNIGYVITKDRVVFQNR